MKTQFPLARKDKLVIRELADEVLVYDLNRNKAFCLNRIAGAVWKQSDGGKSAQQIADDLSRQMDTAIEENVVWMALDQLGRDHLLEYRIPPPANISGLTRREQLKSLGKAAAIAGPIVAALAIPKTAAAASCIANNAVCVPGGTPCCVATKSCTQANPPNGPFTCR